MNLLTLGVIGWVGAALVHVPGDASAKPVLPNPDQLSVVVVGDVGLNRGDLKVHPEGVAEGGAVLRWQEMSRGIKALVNGDVNFMNLETVVTDRNDLRRTNKRQSKPYMFRSHPIGVAHVLDLGFNLISLANNHSYDYGAEGVRETLKHMYTLSVSRKIAYAGLGLNRDEAAKPTIFYAKGARVAFSAVGAITNMIAEHRAGPQKPGTLGFRFPDDWKLAVRELASTSSPLRILSVHYGKERDIRADEKQRKAFGQAVTNGVDLVVGHHAHVVRGVEIRNEKVIFYGLGNFMIRGARDMGASPKLIQCCDYGIASKVHYKLAKDGRYVARAIEVFPLVDMHKSPKPRDARGGQKRIEVLNVLAEALDEPGQGARGVRFWARRDGTGLYCVKGARTDGGKIGALCKGFRSPTKPSKSTRARVKRAPKRR